MKLLICLTTHNRLPYTKKTLASLRHTISDYTDYYLIVCDNASTDGTQRYTENLRERLLIDDYMLNKDNLYPGRATNLGWHNALMNFDATHLMRLDNDMKFERNWDAWVQRYFANIPELGQLGLDHEAIEDPRAEMYKRTINDFTINEWPGCVGGPSVIPRKIWDDGLRWPELRWDDERKTPMQEDSAFSHAIKNKGYLVGHAQMELARTFANKDNWNEFPDYYLKTMGDRGYEENVKLIKEML